MSLTMWSQADRENDRGEEISPSLLWLHLGAGRKRMIDRCLHGASATWFDKHRGPRSPLPNVAIHRLKDIVYDA